MNQRVPLGELMTIMLMVVLIVVFLPYFAGEKNSPSSSELKIPMMRGLDEEEHKKILSDLKIESVSE